MNKINEETKKLYKDLKVNNLRKKQKNMIHFDQNSVISNNPIQKLLNKYQNLKISF